MVPCLNRKPWISLCDYLIDACSCFSLCGLWICAKAVSACRKLFLLRSMKPKTNPSRSFHPPGPPKLRIFIYAPRSGRFNFPFFASRRSCEKPRSSPSWRSISRADLFKRAGFRVGVEKLNDHSISDSAAQEGMKYWESITVNSEAFIRCCCFVANPWSGSAFVTSGKYERDLPNPIQRGGSWDLSRYEYFPVQRDHN